MKQDANAQELNSAPPMTEQQRATYAAQLKAARVSQKLRQQDVAEQAGIARNTYAAMENGSQIPQAEKLWAAMLVLGLQPNTDEPEWLQEWWAILKPLILQLPPSTRGETMGKIVLVLSQAIRAGKDSGGVGLGVQPDLEMLSELAAAKREDREGPLDGQGEHEFP